MIVLWICVLLLCSVIIAQGDDSRAEVMREFYHAEYRHCYPAE